MASTESDVQSQSWSGAVPVVLSLAPTSLSSPTIPPPIHTLIARQSYLHVGLKESVLRLHKFAPTVFIKASTWEEPKPGEQTEETQAGTVPSKTNGPQYPVCWFEDEDSQIALRWHCFAGVLWDMKRRPNTTPWKIRLHFTGYPTSQILPLDTDVAALVERSYRNSLKQALFLQHGTAKVAMNISKQSHQKIWEAIITSNFNLYHQVNCDLQETEKFLPVRLLLDEKPPMQRPVNVDDGYTLGSLLMEWLPSLFRKNDHDETESVLSSVQVTIQGIQTPLSSPMPALWRLLCHPDHFLYILVSSK